MKVGAKMGCRKNGFTLIELVICVTIVAVIAGVALGGCGSEEPTATAITAKEMSVSPKFQPQVHEEEDTLNKK